MTKLYYRIDGRSPATLMNKCPITKEELEKLPFKEQGMWMRLALPKGEKEENLRAFALNYKESIKKLNYVKGKQGVK